MNKQQDFIRVVARMRRAQKAAVKFKMKSQLEAAATAEAVVDKMLEEMGFEQKKVNQLMLDAAASKKTDEEQGSYLTEIE